MRRSEPAHLFVPILALTLLVVGLAAAQETERPPFEGSWLLVEEASDDADAAFFAATDADREAGIGRKDGAGDGGGRSDRGTRRGAGDGGMTRDVQIQETRRRPERLELRVLPDGSAIEFVATDRTLVVPLGAATAAPERPASLPGEGTSAPPEWRWSARIDGDTLIVEGILTERHGLRRAYRVEPESGNLLIEVTAQTPMVSAPFTFDLVYRPAD